jgi:hypothetical protein
VRGAKPKHPSKVTLKNMADVEDIDFHQPDVDVILKGASNIQGKVAQGKIIKIS